MIILTDIRCERRRGDRRSYNKQNERFAAVLAISFALVAMLCFFLGTVAGERRAEQRQQIQQALNR